MRLGFIGGDGHHYLRGLLDEPDAERITVAVAADDAEPSAAAFHARLRAAHPTRDIAFYASTTELFDRFAPDALSVGTVYGRNGVLNEQALLRDIPTVTDKPAAASWEQLERLVSAAGANPARTLLTEFNFRSHREFRSARACVRAGTIGKVMLASAQKSYRFGIRPGWYADRARYGGTVLWVASHAIDAIEFVTGLRHTRVVGRGGNVSRPDYGSMEDHMAVVSELQGGATAVVHADFGRPRAAATHADDRLRVVGSEGVLEIRDGVCRVTTADAPERLTPEDDGVLPVSQELLLALRGGPTDLYSTQETLRTAALLLHARDAVDRREWVDVR